MMGSRFRQVDAVAFLRLSFCVETPLYWAIAFTFALAMCPLSPAFGECVDDPHPNKHCLESVEFDASLNGPPYPSSGVTLLSRIAVEEFPGDATAGADLWGYVSPSGREYALVGMNTAIAFVDITDPVNPVILEVIPHEPAAQSDVKTFGEYAYGVTEGGGGLQVFDLTAIDEGSVTLVNTITPRGLDQAHNLAINEDTGFAYVVGSFNDETDGGLFALSLADPVNPVFAGAWSDAYVHDVQVVTYKQGANAGREIAFASSGLEGYGAPALRIIGVFDKANMWTISTTSYPNARFTHQAWINEHKNLLFLNDEFDERDFGISTSTKVFDISDLGNPRFMRAISTGLPSTDHNLTVVGDFLFEANYTSGLRIFSIAEETFGEELGHFDTFPANDEVGFAGAWGVYANFPSGTVIVSDIESGLFVLDVSEIVPKAVAPNRGGGGGPCFIATAAYGTSLAGEIDVLRTFRDENLLSTASGAAFVDAYYRLSPPLTDHVRHDSLLASGVRQAVSIAIATVGQFYLGYSWLIVLASLGCVLGYRRIRGASKRFIRSMRTLRLFVIAVGLPCLIYSSQSFSECSHTLFPEKHCIAEVPFDASANGPPYPSSGVSLLSLTPLASFPGGVTSGTDIWGYVSPSGREYALMGLNTGFAFVEVTDPEAPVIVEVIPHAEAGQSDAKILGSYAYTVTEGGGGMSIIDLSGIDGGTVTLVNTVTPMGLGQAHNIAINEESGFAYICGSFDSQSDGGLLVLDLADPENPSFAGAWAQEYVHDAQVVSYTSGPYAGMEIAFAYAGADADPTLRILDVTNKGAIVQLSRTEYPNRAFTHQGWLSEDRKYVYLNDEFDELNRLIPTRTYVIDVSDLVNPSFATSFSTGLPSTDHNLTVRGNVLFEANYSSGLRIFDVTSPYLARELGYFDTLPGSNDPGFGGAWGVYAALPSGIVLVSDLNSGLFVLDVSAATSNLPELPGTGRWATVALAGLIALGGLVMLRNRSKA